MKHPKLRDGKRLLSNELYPINQLPHDIIVKIGGYFVHLLYIGRNIESGEICFTWQPHGSQFTIHSNVPVTALKFKIKQPPMLSKDDILHSIGFDSSWIEFV